jgi:septum site-determining protein MinC
LGFSFVNSANISANASVSRSVSNTEKVEGSTGAGKTDEAIVETVEQPHISPQISLFTDKIHRGQIRSGQQIYAKDQNLVIIGSVSAGAEVIADGNIHVYGSLRGRAIAGAKGHHQAQIYCQNLEAELVSINGNYWLSESMEQHWSSPAYIHLSDTELVSSKLI